jgi:hypothetical protein
MAPLSHHPIFKTFPSEIRSGSSSKSDNNNTGLAPKSILTFKGTEVYVALGSTVRYAELREWFVLEDASDDESHYQALIRTLSKSNQ